jgi:osmoprotectant transport system permease protein
VLTLLLALVVDFVLVLLRNLLTPWERAGKAPAVEVAAG